MSGPVPSPSMNGMIGSFGTIRVFVFGLIEIEEAERTPNTRREDLLKLRPSIFFDAPEKSDV
jgi:hypothetical protein